MFIYFSPFSFQGVPANYAVLHAYIGIIHEPSFVSNSWSQNPDGGVRFFRIML